MFKDLGNGYIEIPDNAFGFNYKCYLPPVGYGLNAANGLLQKTDILINSDIPKEQMWIAPELPLDWKKLRNKEKLSQKLDPDYIDPYLEEIRRREWKRRLCGIWFYNYNPITQESILEYITGAHYLYITYWRFQGKRMDFRKEDQLLWYILAYCTEDENCLGLNWITKRKIGKTAVAGCWSYERVSRLSYHHAGLQSKTDEDAEEAFRKAVIHPWQKLPDFFRPRYDLMKGEEPTELRLFATSRRGSKIEEEDNDMEEPLESFYDYKVASESAYDGPELHTYISDEAGKTHKPVSIIERQNVTRYCTDIDYEIKGKHLYVTTVEPDKGEEENGEFQDMTANSNPLERDANNRTGTGLYTYFLPAQRGMYINKEYSMYGYADVQMNLHTIENTLSFYLEKGDTRKASSFKRKNPRNLKEAFSVDGENSLYNSELLNDQNDIISWRHDLTEMGNLKWYQDSPFYIEEEVNGVKKRIINHLIWEKNPNGDYEKVVGWWPTEPCKVIEINGAYKPNNNFRFRVGYDPFKYDKTKDKRRSNAAAFAYQIEDKIFPNEFDNMFTIRYSKRPESKLEANIAVLKMAWLCGCDILVERTAGDNYKDHYKDVNCYGFLSYLPGEVEPGINTDSKGNTTQTICNLTEQYINEHIKKVYYKTLIRKDTGWLGFKVEDTQKFDEPMAAGFTLIAVHGVKNFKKLDSYQMNIEDILPYHKAS